MTAAVMDKESLEALLVEVERSLAASGLTLIPKHVRATHVVDGLDQDSWELLLVLPRPEGATWEPDAVFAVRRKAVEIFDELLPLSTTLPGHTLAVVTTDEALDDDIAIDEEPVPGEDESDGGDE